MLALVLAAALSAAPDSGARLSDHYEDVWSTRETLAAFGGVVAADLVADLTFIPFLPAIDTSSGVTGLKLIGAGAFVVLAVDLALAPLGAMLVGHYFGHSDDWIWRGVGFGYAFELAAGSVNTTLILAALALGSVPLFWVAIGVACVAHWVGLPIVVARAFHPRRETESPPNALAWSF